MPDPMPLLVAFTAALAPRIGQGQAEAVLQTTVNRYRHLCASQPSYHNRALRRHLFGHILPGLALYLTLGERGSTSESALALTEAALESSVRPRARLVHFLGRLPLFFEGLRLTIRPTMASDYPWEGWDTEWVEVSDRQVAFDMHRCFYADVLSRHNAADLTKSFCRLDDIIYGEMSPRVIFDRTLTLGRGDSLCNFRFRKVSVPAGA